MRERSVKPSVLLRYAFTAWSLGATSAFAQVVNPANADPAKQPAPPAPDQPTLDEDRHTWVMPPIDVYGKAPLVEEDRIGEYEQPRWTTHRRFSETRVYVIPQGMVDFEYWLVPETPKTRNSPTEFKTQYEIEFGLPGRFQIDLYAVAHKTGTDTGSFGIDEQKSEVRWALADWGRMFGNPTLYFEWNQVSAAPDHLEAKLLLGGQITSGWHWGSNLVWEHEVSGPQENSNEWTMGVSYTVRDSKFSVGAESQLALVNALDADGRRGDFETAFLLGPSLQFRPLPQMHIDFAPLFGTNPSAPRAKTYLVLGWEF